TASETAEFLSLSYTTLFRSWRLEGWTKKLDGGVRSHALQPPASSLYPLPSVSTARPGKSVIRLSTPKSARRRISAGSFTVHTDRSEEHTSELQSRENLVCRL